MCQPSPLSLNFTFETRSWPANGPSVHRHVNAPVAVEPAIPKGPSALAVSPTRLTNSRFVFGPGRYVVSANDICGSIGPWKALEDLISSPARSLASGFFGPHPNDIANKTAVAAKPTRAAVMTISCPVERVTP